MRLGKIKYGKIAVVIFLTILIWVWADLALHEEHSVSNVPLTIAKSTNRAIWVNFVDENESLIPVYNLKTIVLKGPASKISKVRLKLKTGELQLDFFLDAEQEGMEKSDEYPLDVLSLLRKSDQLKELGLAVQSCDPNKLTVNVVELVEKSLPVECFNEDGMPLQDVESIEPSKVNMFVPEDRRTARVHLTSREIQQARLSAVNKTPFVVLAAGQIRAAATAVLVKMSPEEDRLTDYTINQPTLSVALSPTLLGEYSVNVTNLPQVLSPIAIRATAEAKRAYESQPLPLMTLYVFDDDRKRGAEEQRRVVVYNFPPDFVRERQIELKNPQQSAEAKFKLIPLSSAAASSGGTD